MMKGIRRNQKGTVLLTVLCFTTMCMVIAAIALKISNQANKESTDNVMKSQAQITAEHYLEQFLSNFETVTGTDGKPRYNYDDLKKIAGANEENPGVVTISVNQSGKTSGVNVSNADLSETAAYGGNCTIYVYKQGSGIVVKSMGQYSDQTGLASAYFYGDTPSANLNKNAIETSGDYDVFESATVAGDVLLSYVDPNVTVKFQNNNGTYKSNFKTEGNLAQNSQKVTFGDTVQGNAPTITAEGFMYFYQLIIQTNVGKTDANGKHYGDTGYDPKHLLNKNGYLNTDKKLFITFEQSGTKIGSPEKPIDIYSRGVVIGDIPDFEYGSYDETAVKSFRKTIINTFGNINPSHNTSAKAEINGNVYCYKNSGSTKPMNDDGDFIVYRTNTGEPQVINGDLVVDGNIYLFGYKTLKVTGNVYCTGTVEGTIIGADGKAKTVSKDLPSDARAQKPRMTYAPGLYVYGDPDYDDPSIYRPQNYKTQSPYKMFQQNDEKSKFFKDRFLDALDYTLATPGVATGYIDDTNIANREITINKSCRLNFYQIGTGNAGGNDGAKYTVNVVDKDIWILLPMIPLQENEHPTIHNDTQNSYMGKNYMAARFKVNNPKNGHHCYFVFYYYDSALDKDVVENSVTKNYYSTDDGKDKASLYYERQTGGFGAYGKLEFAIQPNAGGKNAIFTSSFSDWDTIPPTNPEAETNIVFLIPDDVDFHVGYGSWTAIYQAVFYGPNADLTFHCNQSGNNIYGQIKVDNYHIDGSSNDNAVHFCDLSKSSILHSFLTSGAAAAGTLNLQYYIRHK